LDILLIARLKLKFHKAYTPRTSFEGHVNLAGEYRSPEPCMSFKGLMNLAGEYRSPEPCMSFKGLMNLLMNYTISVKS
jgi:hypothetical protein